MKTIHSTRLPVMLLIAVSLAGIAALTSAQTDDEILESARSVIRADRQEVVSKAMQFTETEAMAFWPLYHQYRAEMNTVGDGNRSVTMKFEDGTTRTFPVRRDVDLGRRQVGEKVLFQIAERVAISIAKP